MALIYAQAPSHRPVPGHIPKDKNTSQYYNKIFTLKKRFTRSYGVGLPDEFLVQL